MNKEKGECLTLIAMLIAIIGGLILIAIVWHRVELLTELQNLRNAIP